MPCVVFILLLISFIYGLKKLISSENPENTLMISLVWVVYNMIPPFLLLWYTWVGQGSTLRVRSPPPLHLPARLLLLSQHSHLHHQHLVVTFSMQLRWDWLALSSFPGCH
jgi:hypothetical protein